MGHHFMVDEFVARGDLGGAVQHQHLAEESVVEQNQMLMPGLHFLAHPLDRIGHAEAELVEQRLRRSNVSRPCRPLTENGRAGPGRRQAVKHFHEKGNPG